VSAGADAKASDELNINEERDIAYHRKEWRAQRFAWVVMLLLVIAALLGLLGAPGWLGTATTTAADGSIEIEYDRISRYHAPTELVIAVDPAFVEDSEIRLWIGAGYAESLSIDAIVPEPERAEVRADGVVYTFNVADASGPLQIVVHYEHDSYWRANGELGLANGEPVKMSQVVMP
jgi:hypothetical protein